MQHPVHEHCKSIISRHIELQQVKLKKVIRDMGATVNNVLKLYRFLTNPTSCFSFSRNLPTLASNTLPAFQLFPHLLATRCGHHYWKPPKGRYLKDVRTEGEGGLENCSNLRMNSTDRLREMWMRGGSKILKILWTSFKYRS